MARIMSRAGKLALLSLFAMILLPRSTFAADLIPTWNINSTGILTITDPNASKHIADFFTGRVNVCGGVYTSDTTNSCNGGTPLAQAIGPATPSTFYDVIHDAIGSTVTQVGDTVVINFEAFANSVGGGTGTDYYIKIWDDVAGNIYYVYPLHRSGSVWNVESVDGSATRFISIHPEYGTTTPTGIPVPLSAEYFLKQDDLFATCALTGGLGNCSENLFLDLINIDRIDQGGNHYAFPLISGSNTQVSVKSLPDGLYTGRWSINVGGLELAATTTDFTVGTTSLSNDAVEYWRSHATTSPVSSPSECSGLSFLSIGCFRALIFMTPQQTQNINDRMTVLLFGKVPLAYLVRVKEIMTSGATTTLPILSYAFASSSPLAGATIAFNPWQYGYDNPTSPLRTVKDDHDGKDIWQIMELPFSTIVYLILLFKIINDITHIHVQEKHNL